MKQLTTILFVFSVCCSYSQSFFGGGIGIIQHPINDRFETKALYSIGYKQGFQLNERFEFRTGLSVKYTHLNYATHKEWYSSTSSSFSDHEYDLWKYSANIPLLVYFNPNQFRFYIGASIAFTIRERTNDYSRMGGTSPYDWSISDSYGEIYNFKNDDFLTTKDSYVAHTGIGYVFYKQLETSLNFSAGNRYQYLTLEVNYCFGKRYRKEANPPSPL